MSESLFNKVGGPFDRMELPRGRGIGPGVLAVQNFLTTTPKTNNHPPEVTITEVLKDE